MMRCTAFFFLLTALAARANFAPTDVPGLEVWLRADYGVQDASGQTPGNNAAIAQWLDASGKNRHATQVTGVNRPLYKASGLNGLPAVTGAASRWMNFSTPISLRTMFMVGTPVGATEPWPIGQNVDVIVGHTSNGVEQQFVDIFLRYGHASETISYDGVGMGTINGRHAINGGALSGYDKGHFPTLTTPILVYMNYESAPQNFSLLMRRPYQANNQNWFYDGDMSELVVFNRLLTAREMNMVGRYLQEKYALNANYPPFDTVYANTGTADLIGAVSARLHAEVEGVGQGAPAVLRVYYGKTDGGGSASAWWTNEVVSASAGDGAHSHTTTVPLETGETYFYRFSAQAPARAEVFAMISRSFKTRPFDAPARFQYVGAQDTLNTPTDWMVASQWVNLDLGARLVPGKPGDSVESPATIQQYNHTLNLTNAVSLKSITFGLPSPNIANGVNDPTGSFRVYGTNTAVRGTLVFDSGVAGAAATVTPQGARYLLFGRNAPAQDNLEIRLESPLHIRRDVPRGGRMLFFSNAPISSGAGAAPTPVEFSIDDAASVNNELFVAFAVANSFAGDIILDRRGGGVATNATKLVLHVGRLWGTVNITADDAMFGDPANRIILRRNPHVILNGNAGESFTFNRTIIGSGRLDRLRLEAPNSTFAPAALNPELPLVLGPRAVVSPGEDNAFGRVIIRSSTLATDPGATFRIKIAKHACDTVFLDCRAAVNLTCGLEVVELDNTIRAGDSWVVMTGDARIPSLNVKFSSKTPGYQTGVVQNGDGTWSVTLTRVSPGSLFMVR